jgi:hypothetical protein
VSEFETGPSSGDEDQKGGVSILPEEPADVASDEDPNVDPNVVLNEILQALSGLQAVMGMFDARVSQLEKLTGYLLQKDPQFMANLQAAQEQADAQVEANKPAAGDGKAEG